MELPFYLMSGETPGTSWDGTVSLHDDELHFEMTAGGTDEATAFDLPLNEVSDAQFLRGLVSRKLSLTVGSAEMRRLFPAGVSGQEVQLMVARDDAEFGTGGGTEIEFERLAGEIAQRSGGLGRTASEGLPS